MSARDVLDPAETYLYLADGGAVERLDLDGSFWEDLTSGKLDLDQGRLMMATEMSRNMEHWEMHPDGEEILICQSGAYDIILEGDLGEPARLDPEHPATVIPAASGTASTWSKMGACCSSPMAGEPSTRN